MPRLVFATKEDMLKWCNDFIRLRPKNFIVFITDDFEIIVHQTVSTRPIFVAYYKALSDEELDEIVNELTEKHKLSCYRIKRIEWDLERGVGIQPSGVWW